MAEFDHVLAKFTDPLGGVCRLVAICEGTQTEAIPEGGTSPLVVRVRVENSTTKKGRGTWVHANGQVVTRDVLPGENAETNIAPSRRLSLWRFPHGLSWGP